MEIEVGVCSVCGKLVGGGKNVGGQNQWAESA